MEMVNAYSWEDWHMIRSMREQGMSISEIARKTGMSRKTVRKYIGMDKPIKYSRKVVFVYEYLNLFSVRIKF